MHEVETSRIRAEVCTVQFIRTMCSLNNPDFINSTWNSARISAQGISFKLVIHGDEEEGEDN